MPQGNKNKRKHNHRGRGGRGGGRGHMGPGRGRGRGGPRDDISIGTTGIPVAVPATQPQPRFRYAHTNADTDVVIQQWAQPADASGNGNINGNGDGNRKRGSWRGGTPKSRSGAGAPSRGAETPQRGNATPRWGGGRSEPGTGFRGPGQGRGGGRDRGTRGRGRGTTNSRGPGTPNVVLIDEHFAGSARRPHPRPGVGRSKANANYSYTRRRLGKDAPLSDLLNAERPLLRPVVFVRPTQTSSFLFLESEDVLEPASHIANANTTEESHVPTADRVAQLFHGDNASDSDSESHDDDGLEEIDFADLAQVRAEVDAIAYGQATMTTNQARRRDREEIEEIDFTDLASIRAEVDAAIPLAPAAHRGADPIPEETFTGVYNHVKEATQAPSSMDVDAIVDDQPDDVQQIALASTSGPTADDAFESKPSISISNTISILESRTQDLDTILVEEGNANVPLSEPRPKSTAAPTGTDDHRDPTPLFFVDTKPTRPFNTRSASDVILIDRAGHGDTLGDQYDDEERIVYVAPHPRSGRVSPIPALPRVKLPKTSMLTGTPITAGEDQGEYKGEDEAGVMPDHHDATRAGLEEGDETNSGPTASTSADPAACSSCKTEAWPRQRRQHKRQKKQSRLRFGALGAMVSEARLREADANERRHPRWATRRKGDSDLDWGSEDEDEDEQEQARGAGAEEDAEEREGDDGMDVVSNGLGEMTLDPDLDLGVNAMQGFLKSMSAEGSQFVTTDDLEDEARMRREDEEGQGGPEGSSDSEIGDDDEEDEEEDDDDDEAFNAEEAMLIAESEGDEELSDDSDENLSPKASFQARLRKIRERSRSLPPETAQHHSDEEGEEDDAPKFEILPGTRSANDESSVTHINVSCASLTVTQVRVQQMLEENSHILSDRNRKQKKGKGKAASHHENGAEVFMDDPEFTTPVAEKKKKQKKGDFEGTYLSAELKAQWARDREKKAERRRERKEEMQRNALDPLYLTPHQGGKGGGRGGKTSQEKAMRAATRLDPSEAREIAPRTLLGVDARTEEGVAALESYVRAFAFGASSSASAYYKGKGKGKSSESVAFPPMDKEARKVVHALAQAFGLKSVSKGNGERRYTTLIRTTRTVNEGRVRGVVKRFTGKSGGKSGNGGGGGPRHREGEVVGKEAPKIGEGNVGFKMLAMMGWTEGERIGGAASVGIDDPLTAKIKHTKLGLGALNRTQ